MDVATGAEAVDCGCDSPLATDAAGKVVPTSTGAGGIVMNDVRVTGDTLRSMVLSDVDGASVRPSELIGEEGRAVVVFLRHLG